MRGVENSKDWQGQAELHLEKAAGIAGNCISVYIAEETWVIWGARQNLSTIPELYYYSVCCDSVMQPAVLQGCVPGSGHSYHGKLNILQEGLDSPAGKNGSQG